MAVKPAPQQRADPEPAQQAVPDDAAARWWPRLVPLDEADARAARKRGAARYLVAFHRGYMRGMAGQYQKAIALFREAADLKPDFGVAHYNLGCAYGANRQFPEAIAAFRKVIEIDRNDAFAHFILGWTLAKDGQQALGRDAIVKALQIRPSIREQIVEFFNPQKSELVSKEIGYTDDVPPSQPADTSQPGMRDDFNTTVKKAKAETLARGKARPSTHQLATYRALVQHVDLLNPELREDERLTRARRLVRAYHRVRERRPKFHDRNEQLQAAFSIVNRFEYQQKLRREAAFKLAVG